MSLSWDINKSDIFWLFISRAINILLQCAFHELDQITFGLLQSCRERCQTFDITQHCIYLQGRTKLLILSLKVKVKNLHFFYRHQAIYFNLSATFIKGFHGDVCFLMFRCESKWAYAFRSVYNISFRCLLSIDYELLKWTWKIGNIGISCDFGNLIFCLLFIYLMYSALPKTILVGDVVKKLSASCIYIYTYTNIYIHIHEYMYAYIHIYIHMKSVQKTSSHC